MKKNSLTPNKGLSLSQAQSISNLCNQRASEISNKLESINNYSKSVKVDGNLMTILNPNPIPDDVVDLLIEKAKLHACQAFLMENIQAKDSLLHNKKNSSPDFSSIEKPEEPLFKQPEGLIDEVDEEYGWSQLKLSEINEYYEAQAYASHIGQFIHKNSKLSRLRSELPTLPSVEWMEIERDKKTPVMITVHHKSEDLLIIHEELAKLHRKYEQRVNYFKSKVKNITTQKNSEISKYNSTIQKEVNNYNLNLLENHKIEMNKYQEKLKLIEKNHIEEKHGMISEVASMRISVDDRFKKIIEIFMSQLNDKEEV